MTQSLAETIIESDTNYNTGRLESAARGFEHVADTMSEDEMSDALYFYYRALQSYTEMKDLGAQSRLLNKISGFCLNHSINVLSLKMEQATDSKDRIAAMDRTQQILKKQDKHEERRSLLSTLVDSITEEIRVDTDFEKRYGLADKLIKFSLELLDIERLNQSRKIVARLILDNYKDKLDNISEHNQIIVGDRMLRSAQLFSEIGDTMQSKKIMEMIEPLKIPDSIVSDYNIIGKDIVFVHADDILGENFESRYLQILLDQIEDENYYVIIGPRSGQIDHPYYIDYLKQVDRIIEIPAGSKEDQFIVNLIKNANATLISNTFETGERLNNWLDTIRRRYVFDPSTNKYIFEVDE